jgi:regulator of sigma E protease
MNYLYGLYVAVGVGLIIFVHELGHFLVAKACGVKCEKFMIGFDIAGIRLLSIRRGETLYGIGILPLGGYVKMLGQEDNPAQLRREMERAKQAAAESKAAAGPSDAPIETSTASADAGEASPEARLYNPRSYLAKSVPQRMAIISAGVIMNMIFAFVFAVLAYLYGVKDSPCVVGAVVAGGGAWQSGIRAGDTILEVGGAKVRTFQQMLRAIVSGEAGEGLPVVVKRPGVKDPFEVIVKPQKLGGKPTIGIISSQELQIGKEKDSLMFLPGSAAEKATPPLLHGDRIVKVDGQAVENYGQLQDVLIARADKPLEVTVDRIEGSDANDSKSQKKEEVTITVPVNPMKQFGMAMTMGTIASVQVGSPAARAEIKPGDLLTTLEGEAVGDPLKLPDRIRKLAGKKVQLGLNRNGKPVELTVKLSATPRCVLPDTPDSPVALSELGVAYFVLNTVASVDPGVPAAGAGLKSGDRLTSVKIVPPTAEDLKDLRKKYGNDDINPAETTFPMKDDERNWPCFMLLMQSALPGTTFEFTWQRDSKEMTGKAATVAAENWFNPERGWILEPMREVQQAHSFGEAVRMGGQETLDSALLVYRLLHSFSTNQVSIRNISGPLGILWAALGVARLGLGNLLAFMTLLSANLAVLNFLPIPVLDGGHMVLLAYEGIRGKPADERVQEALTWIGLILLLTLMIWAFGLDLGLFSRPGAH